MTADSSPDTASVPLLGDDRVSILLVDDRPDKLLALEAILGDLGQNMVRAYSGREALRALLQQDFAVILLDVNMPMMDGFETAEMIRARPRSQQTPIIFFTAMNEMEAHVFRSYSLGAVDFIRTPVVPEILKAKVSVFVDLYKKTEQVKRQGEQMRLLQEREHRQQLGEAVHRLDAETKRNRFFTLALDMLAIADFSGTFKQLNPSWERTLGFSDDELTARPILEFVHPDDREATGEQLAALRAGAPITYFENRFAAKSGGYRWLGWTAAPFAAEGLVYIFARDLTERRHAEEERVKLIREQTARAAAEASERRSTFLAEAGVALTSSLDVGETLAKLVHLAVPTLADWCVIDVLDEHGRPRRLAVGHARPEDEALAEEMKGFAPGLEGRRPEARLLHPGESALLVADARERLDELAEDESHRALLERLGPRSMMVVPIVSRERTLGVMSLLSTTSGRVFARDDLDLAEELGRRAALAVDNARLYRASQDARAGAEKANRAKDEFLATLSHELRTPLTPILGWTVMLRSGTLDPTAIQRGLEVIERNVRAQTQLIGDLLDVSRIITGKLRLEVSPIAVVPVVEAGVEAVRSSAEAKEIALGMELPSEVPTIVGDPDRLQQVVWNLVSNAVKFTPQGGRIDVRLRQDGSFLSLSVTDNGKGIEPEFIPHVFERFRQADSTSTRSHGGLGLGLAIVRHLVELHGGTVQAESEGIGKGSTFTVRLPLTTAVAGPAAPKPDLADPDVRLDGVRVMVVEDEQDVRDFLRMSLVHYGAEVTAFETSADALVAVEAERPDVLVSDIGMPGEDGYAFIRRVRALGPDRGGQVPAAALTAYAKGEDGQRVLSAGFQVHLPKPVQPADLANVVATLAGRAR
ncbi:MAG TPA: response regulator [Vicinamibacteria bacterium]|nr:response regulator [Vicinamibacteria bacterium]